MKSKNTQIYASPDLRMIVEQLTVSTGPPRRRDTDFIDQHMIEQFKDFQIRQGHVYVAVPNTPLNCYAAANGDGTAFFFMTYEQHTLSNTICCFSNEAFQKAQYLVTELLTTLQHTIDLTGQLPSQPQWMYSVPVVQSEVAPAIIEQADEMALYVYNALYRAYQTAQA